MRQASPSYILADSRVTPNYAQSSPSDLMLVGVNLRVRVLLLQTVVKLRTRAGCPHFRMVSNLACGERDRHGVA